MTCPHCESDNPAGKKFCGDCGAALENRCPQCGADNPVNKKFCGECDASLASSNKLKAQSQTDSRLATPDPRAYTPKHLADKILQSKAALEGERKQVTVLFADVKGSMELGVGFSTRMGLNSGEVIVGKIGDDLRMDYTAQGHTQTPDGSTRRWARRRRRSGWRSKFVDLQGARHD